MTRLIDANELKKELKKWFPEFTLEGIEAKTLFNQILQDIDNAPTITPFASVEYETIREYERPHGEWKITLNDLYTCSYCGNYGNPRFFKFCPYCGADMRGGES